MIFFFVCKRTNKKKNCDLNTNFPQKKKIQQLFLGLIELKKIKFILTVSQDVLKVCDNLFGVFVAALAGARFVWLWHLGWEWQGLGQDLCHLEWLSG